MTRDPHPAVTPPVTPPLENPFVAFRIHGIVFFATIAMLILFDAMASQEPWVHYVFFGWGIGLFAHGLAAALTWRERRRVR